MTIDRTFFLAGFLCGIAVNLILVQMELRLKKRGILIQIAWWSRKSFEPLGDYRREFPGSRLTKLFFLLLGAGTALVLLSIMFRLNWLPTRLPVLD
jgi:hypothetical protein